MPTSYGCFSSQFFFSITQLSLPLKQQVIKTAAPALQLKRQAHTPRSTVVSAFTIRLRIIQKKGEKKGESQATPVQGTGMYVLSLSAVEDSRLRTRTKRFRHYQRNKWLFTTDRAVLRSLLQWRTPLRVRYTFLECHMAADHALNVVTKTKIRLCICERESGYLISLVFTQLNIPLVIHFDILQEHIFLIEIILVNWLSISWKTCFSRIFKFINARKDNRQKTIGFNLFILI